MHKFGYFSPYLFLVNPQLVFFGEPTYLLESNERRAFRLVDKYLDNISKDFDVILILEDLGTGMRIY